MLVLRASQQLFLGAVYFMKLILCIYMHFKCASTIAYVIFEILKYVESCVLLDANLVR